MSNSPQSETSNIGERLYLTPKQIHQLPHSWKEDEIKTIQKNGFSILPYKQWIHAADGTRVKNEILARLKSPDGAIIKPDDFIPLLSLEQLQTLTAGIIKRTLESKEGLSNDISINIWIWEILDSSFLKDLNHACRLHKVLTWHVTLEILENIPENLDSELLHFVDIARNLWFQIAVDDYGASHSTLRRVGIIRPDIVKLDGKNTESMTPWNTLTVQQREERKRHLAELMSLSKDVRWTIIAEHVDNPWLLVPLQWIWVKSFQWYRYSIPEPLK